MSICFILLTLMSSVVSTHLCCLVNIPKSSRLTLNILLKSNQIMPMALCSAIATVNTIFVVILHPIA